MPQSVNVEDLPNVKAYEDHFLGALRDPSWNRLEIEDRDEYYNAS
jgi:hypothetical protein